MNSEKVRIVEEATLRTFQEEIPSIYFSDKPSHEFDAYMRGAEATYRGLFKLPPRIFSDADLIDFGAGTGENTIALARWGARCTLVEMNGLALDIARRVFEAHAPSAPHRFVQASIFDFEDDQLYDVVQCRGVLAHTGDKEAAFQKIARFVRPGGFLIYGDPNKAGGFQNMLQRFAVYKFASSWDEMVDVCETLFKEDIDRSQNFVRRTRRSIIFDRWVVQSQDDPSISEVLDWLQRAGLEFYSGYPPFLVPLVGDGTHYTPRFDAASVDGMPALAETVWLLQDKGDIENAEVLDAEHRRYSNSLASLADYVANWSAGRTMESDRFKALAEAVARNADGLLRLDRLRTRLRGLMDEAAAFVSLVERASLAEVQAFISSCQFLFKGACGVRHVDVVAYRPHSTEAGADRSGR